MPTWSRKGEVRAQSGSDAVIFWEITYIYLHAVYHKWQLSMIRIKNCLIRLTTTAGPDRTTTQPVIDQPLVNPLKTLK